MRVDQFREFGKDFHHLVGTLTASRNNHDIGFGLLGDGVLQYRLTGTESSRDKSRSSFHDGVEGVDRTNSCLQQLEGTGFFLVSGKRYFYRPALDHVQFGCPAVAVLHHSDGFIDIVITFLSDTFYCVFSFHGERYHDLVRLKILIHLSQPRSGDYFVARSGNWLEMP